VSYSTVRRYCHKFDPMLDVTHRPAAELSSEEVEKLRWLATRVDAVTCPSGPACRFTVYGLAGREQWLCPNCRHTWTGKVSRGPDG
jgi:hypothetical protein